MRPYIAIDIETTGLDVKKVQILQIGWVIDDGVSPRDQLEKGSLLIANPSITYGENYAIGMNAWIFQELMKKQDQRKYPTRKPMAGIHELMVAIKKAAKMAHDYDIAQGAKKPNQRVQIAGKNAGNFDWPIILNNLTLDPDSIGEHECMESALAIVEKVDHRFVDVGAAFYSDFGKNSSFEDICKLANIPPINHDALDDAMAVVIALRWKMGIKI